jgi:hypothetical protein
VALIPRMVGGLAVAEIARVFLCAGDHHGTADHPRKGQDQGGSQPFRVPSTEDLLGPVRIATSSSRRNLNRLLLAVLSSQLADSEDKYPAKTSAAAGAAHASGIN